MHVISLFELGIVHAWYRREPHAAKVSCAQVGMMGYDRTWADLDDVGNHHAADGDEGGADGVRRDGGCVAS